MFLPFVVVVCRMHRGSVCQLGLICWLQFVHHCTDGVGLGQLYSDYAVGWMIDDLVFDFHSLFHFCV